MNTITTETTVASPVEKVWEVWTNPTHITVWNQASPDWECPHAENDLRVGGKFLSRMSAKDGSASFDFEGTYTEVEPHSVIKYMMADGRKVHTTFTSVDGTTHIVTVFDAESENALEYQKAGWQAILTSFKNYTETQI